MRVSKHSTKDVMCNMFDLQSADDSQVTRKLKQAEKLRMWKIGRNSSKYRKILKCFQQTSIQLIAETCKVLI